MTADYTVRNYPGSAVKTRLTTGMTNIDSTTDIETSTGWPTANFWMLVDVGQPTEELMFVATRSALHLSGIVRNIGGGGAFTHAALGSNLVWVTACFQDFVEANAVAAALTTKGDSLWKGGTPSVAPARLAAGADKQIIRYLAANGLGVETTWKGTIPEFASTGTRDAAIASPTGGQGAYVDSGDAAEGPVWYNGTSWRLPWNMAWGAVAPPVTTTTAQTGISTVTDLTSLTITFTAVTGRRYKYTGQVTVKQNTSAAIVDLLVTTTAPATVIQTTAQMAAANQNTMNFIGFETISAGSVTRKLRLQTSAGTVDAQTASIASFFIVEDIGPSGNPT